MTGPRRYSETELHAFVDGELAADERAEVEAMLAAVPADLERARDFHDLNEALRQRYASRLTEPLPPAMKKSVARFGAKRTLVLRTGKPLAAAIAVILRRAQPVYALRGLFEHSADRGRLRETALGAHTVFVAGSAPSGRSQGRRGASRPLAGQACWRRRASATLAHGLAADGGRCCRTRRIAGSAVHVRGHEAPAPDTLPAQGDRLTNTSFRFYGRDGFGSFYWIDLPLAYALSASCRARSL